MSDLRREIGELWRQVNHGIHDRMRQAFRGSELPPMAFILLRIITHTPGISVSELARRSGTVKSHVSKMVDQLAAQGFVQKRTDPDDQRLQRVYVTEEATKTKTDMESRAMSVWNRIMAEVPEGELEDVARAFRILRTALEQSGGNKGSEDPYIGEPNLGDGER